MPEATPRPHQEHFVADAADSALGSVDAVDESAAPASLWAEAWRNVRRRPLFWVSASLISLVLVVAAFPALFTSLDPRFCELRYSFDPPTTGHPFGYDRQGCDIYARTIYGARASVSAGVLTTALVVALGSAVGAIAGFYGRWFDSLLSRVTDIFFAIPLVLAAIVVMQMFRDSRNISTVVLVLGVFGWPQIARITRGAVLSVKNSEFITAATALGASRFATLARHIMPNAAAPIIVTATVSLGIFIVAEATLSFLGIGLPPSITSWGADISKAQTSLRAQPSVLFYPAGALALTVLSFIMMGDVVRDALDPEGAHPMTGIAADGAPPPAGPQDSAALLEIRDLEVAFTSATGTVRAVRGANLTVYPGQTVAIVGESGSGKSTTAHAVIGLLPGTGRVTGGSIVFNGQDITHPPEREMVALRGKEIGLVPQDPMSNLNPVWRIGFQVKEALVANGIAKGSAADARVAELLAESGLPDAERRAKQYPHEFSGGMRQRALIAIGLAARPKLLIADEPTSALDVTVQKRILDHLQGLTEQLGTAVLFITHDLGLAAERAEHLVVMYRGQVVESGPSLEILREPQHPYTQRLVASAPSLASRRIRSVKERDTAQAAEPNRAATDDVVRVENLTKVFKLPGGRPGAAKTFKAVDDVSFAVRRGTTMALVGESGSGKSTVANVVLNLLEPTQGAVYFDGTDMAALDRKQLFAFRRRVQPIFQNPYGSLDPMYSIFRTIEEPLRTHKVGDRRSREKKVRDLLDLVALPASTMRRFPNELSGGQRQRIAIARALALDPEMIVCDEAVSALDVLVQAQILTLLNDLQAELGLSYLFITHDLAVVRQIADEVCVMKDGSVVERASTDEVFNSPREPYTRELLDVIPGAHLDVFG